MKILVTGASGFVGSALCRTLLAQGHAVRGTLLPGQSPAELVCGVEPAPIDPVGPETAWGGAVAGIDAVIHLAARVHVMRETAGDPLSEFRTVNSAGTRRLASSAAAAGVRRLVFMSTIGVHGNETPRGGAFRATDRPHPHNAYSLSKLEGELALREVAGETGLEVVVLRAPLVYGPGNPGNFLSLLGAVTRGVPLPFAAVRNRRTLLYVGNLVDALSLCACHPDAAGRTYLVGDREDVSTAELLRRLAALLGTRARLFPVPEGLLRLAAAAAGRLSMAAGLLNSLTVDGSGIAQELGWRPPFTLDEGLSATASWYLAKGGKK